MPAARRTVRDLREPPEAPGEADAPRTDPSPHPVARVAATLNRLHSQGPQRGQRAEAVSLQETSVGAAPGLEAVRRSAEINPVGLSVSQELPAPGSAHHTYPGSEAPYIIYIICMYLFLSVSIGPGRGPALRQGADAKGRVGDDRGAPCARQQPSGCVESPRVPPIAQRRQRANVLRGGRCVCYLPR